MKNGMIMIKEWANAVLVTESSRNLYKLASPDTKSTKLMF